MTERDGERRLLDEVRKLKRRVTIAEEERQELLEAKLSGRLRHVEDFERFIGLKTVQADDGRIDWYTLERRLAQLLTDRPELAA